MPISLPLEGSSDGLIPFQTFVSQNFQNHFSVQGFILCQINDSLGPSPNSDWIV